MTRTIGREAVVAGARDRQYTNLGPGFHIELGGATSVSVQRGPNRAGARVVWVSTYGNTVPNDPVRLRGEPPAEGYPLYVFDHDGREAAIRILEEIEADPELGAGWKRKEAAGR